MQLPQFRLRTLMLVVAVTSLAIAAWRFVPDWLFYYQSIRRLTG
jgi:hypothetical protein